MHVRNDKNGLYTYLGPTADMRPLPAPIVAAYSHKHLGGVWTTVEMARDHAAILAESFQESARVAHMFAKADALHSLTERVAWQGISAMASEQAREHLDWTVQFDRMIKAKDCNTRRVGPCGA